MVFHSFFFVAFHLILATLCNGQNPTPIYIDAVPGYENLSSCAEAPLSALIRNMENGCGDDSQLTSFSCFCTDSSKKFSFDISTQVVSNCGASRAVQATSAVNVFHEYCVSGSVQLRTAEIPEITGGGHASAIPTATASAASATASSGGLRMAQPYWRLRAASLGVCAFRLLRI